MLKIDKGQIRIPKVTPLVFRVRRETLNNNLSKDSECELSNFYRSFYVLIKAFRYIQSKETSLVPRPKEKLDMCAKLSFHQAGQRQLHYNQLQ